MERRERERARVLKLELDRKIFEEECDATIFR